MELNQTAYAIQSNRGRKKPHKVITGRVTAIFRRDSISKRNENEVTALISYELNHDLVFDESECFGTAEEAQAQCDRE